MVINLTPEQFLSLYRTLNASIASDSFSSDAEDIDSVLRKMEDRLLDLLHEREDERISTGFDKWLESEKTKVEWLEEELEHIKKDVPNEALLNMFKPTTKKRKSKKTSRVKK